MTRPSALRLQHATDRAVALTILERCRAQHRFVQDVVDQVLDLYPLQAEGKRLATHLAYGVLRRKKTLDALLARCVERPRHRVEPWLWNALRIGVYQLGFLSRIPAYAAIHETVGIAQDLGKPRAKGFINAVLRRALTLLGATPLGWAEEWGAATLPVPPEAVPEGHTPPTLAHGVALRLLAQPVFPDPDKEHLAYMASAFSLPRWLLERWSQRMEPSKLTSVVCWSIVSPPVWLRVNSLRTRREDVLDRLQQAGIEVYPGDHPQSVRLASHHPIRTLPGYEAGWFAVQDLSAMYVASALDPRPGWRVLDLCAAPGGKTTHLAELMGNEGLIVACDRDPKRLHKVQQLAQRLGISIVQTHLLAQDQDPPSGPFDGALVDAPCTNTGVLARRPEVRYRLQPHDLQELVPVQTKLLIQAAERLEPRGVLVYSTCSIEPEENEMVVDNVLAALPWLRLEWQRHFDPGMPADGGYVARLQRIQ
ncbi:MAG: hypothetical protein C4297_05610 [Gemmataceae bacterium]